MTRTTSLATLWCTALVATLTAYGCGSSSTIDTGAGGSAAGSGGTTGGAGGGIVIITGTGGTTTTGAGGAVGGTGGVTGGVDAGRPPPPPADAGVNNMCTPNAACTAGFTCDGACMAGGRAGTRACMCGNNNNRLACGACMVADAGPPPPPVDAGPRPDAGLICAGNVMNGRACVIGTSLPCTRNAGGGNTQMCTCVEAPVPDAGADAAVPARWNCM